MLVGPWIPRKFLRPYLGVICALLGTGLLASVAAWWGCIRGRSEKVVWNATLGLVFNSILLCIFVLITGLGTKEKEDWARSKSVFQQASNTASEAKTIAQHIGYPVALKAQAAALAHKSEAGGVALNIADADALAAAWTRMMELVAAAQPGVALDGVLIEAMAPAGVELIVGARRDPQWGPVVMVGLGGIWAEALNDVRLMPADLPRERIIVEIGRLKGARVLHGLRGSAPVDLAAVADVAVCIGALMRARPEITEFDINPLVAYPRGVLALDALIVAS